MKKYSDNPLRVRLHHIQEESLNEMMTNTSYCMSKGIYSKSDVVRNSINNVLKDYQKSTLGTR
jgi:hypothetical protein